MPLNKSIISKIEKISQAPDAKAKICGFKFLCLQDRDIVGVASTSTIATTVPSLLSNVATMSSAPVLMLVPKVAEPITAAIAPVLSGGNRQHTQLDALHKMAQKSGSFESTFRDQTMSACVGSSVGGTRSGSSGSGINDKQTELHTNCTSSSSGGGGSGSGIGTKKHKHSKRHYLKMRLQFEDPNLMDCGGLNEFLSSSSLSSSDSEAAETNESDREGDDELTDWPGNEAMVNFTSKNDFKRARPRSLKPTLPQIKSDELGQDDDTLMSADEMVMPIDSIDGGGGNSNSVGGGSADCEHDGMHQHIMSTAIIHSPQPPNTLNLSVKYSPASSLADIVPMSSMPIDILENVAFGSHRTQVESEMSGETSNHFLSSPNTCEVREIRAGCRRIRDERPGFTILTSVNEDLSK